MADRLGPSVIPWVLCETLSPLSCNSLAKDGLLGAGLDAAKLPPAVRDGVVMVVVGVPDNPSTVEGMVAGVEVDVLGAPETVVATDGALDVVLTGVLEVGMVLTPEPPD